MSKCKNLCGKDLTGRQKHYCSDKCRKQSVRSAVLKVKSDKLGQNETRTPNSDTEVYGKSDLVKGAGLLKEIHEDFVNPTVLDKFDMNKVIAHTLGEDVELPDKVGQKIDLSPGAINCPESSKISFMTAAELYLAINSYPQDTWKDSPEFKELMKRLHSKSIEELESEGYSVPCWKYSEAA